MNDDQSQNLLNEEICNLLDSIKINPKQKSKNFSKMRPLEIIPEDREKPEKNKSLNKGLTENILNDFEKKEKARKGLLFLLNKISGGSFCPEIKEYFTQLKKENLQKKKEILNQNKKDDERETSRMKSSSNLKRQNLIENKIPKFRVSEEEIFKLNCEPSHIATMTIMKNKKKEKENEKEKEMVILKKRKNEMEKKLNFVAKIFPEKKYKNDIASNDKEFKLYFSDSDELNNPFFKLNKKKKYFGKNMHGNIKNRSNKEETRRIGVLNANVKPNYRNESVNINMNNNNNYRASLFGEIKKSKNKQKKKFSVSSSQES